MTLIATGGCDYPTKGKPVAIQIWDAKTGKLVAALKGHTYTVNCLAWTNDGQRLIDYLWIQTAVLIEHPSLICAIAISPNDRILASASLNRIPQLWNLDNGQSINSPIQHPQLVQCVSFSADGKLLAAGCADNNAYTWDVATIVREAGLNDLLSDSKVKKSVLHADATRRPPAYRIPQGFFDGIPSHHKAVPTPQHIQVARFLPACSTAVPLIPMIRTELQGRSPTVLEVPYAKGKRRNACAREKRKRLLPLKNPTASSSQLPKPNAIPQSGTATQTQPSLQPQPAVSNSSATPAVGDNTAATTSTPSRPDVMLIQAGLWARFWLFIGCLSPEYQDGHH
ncbi:WD40-repeat-containing domain protein [Suillus subalutaceus]|uniref:WD40-repeat-containing domain protein n=1 Tax=Suillus subalutaceus TaxID=48586 RepID=UPI001B85F676|nr:WD40-repeat-containing domain protein [Suillus subalutaceus]KAG1839333.1 WD40-repeat-containing domain protein [Suillus subalutaceus]